MPIIWRKEQVEAMDLLKLALTTLPALVSVDYIAEVGDIIFTIDASLEGWGGVLIQLVQGKRHPSRYESGIWSSVEKKYDATKQKCRGVFESSKKVQVLAIWGEIYSRNRRNSFGCAVKPVRDGPTWSFGDSMDCLDSAI